MPKDAPLNRLGLARWLVDPDNPLVARVTVNRWWAEFFGHGLVATLEDFGTQSDAPTHRELLDWLAVEFMNPQTSRERERPVAWSMKHIHRLIVTSATYQQSSRVPPALVKRDPDNTLYARGPRLRLDAETIRDNALAVSGLLSRKMGGPPVMPPQPPGIWTVTGVVDNTYRTSSGADRYRRGLYTIWRRSSPYPSFVAFDAPDRASCIVKRPRTNTPLQALTLLNDPNVRGKRRPAAGSATSAPRKESQRSASFTASALCLARQPTCSVRSHRSGRFYDQALAKYQSEIRPPPRRALAKMRRLRTPRSETMGRLVPRGGGRLLNLDEAITK